MIEREVTLPTQRDLFITLIMSKLYGHGRFDVIHHVGDLTLQAPYSVGNTLFIDATGPYYREYKSVMKFTTLPLSDTHIKVTAECKEIPGLPEYFVELWDDLMLEYAGMITVKVVGKPAIDAPRDRWIAYYFARKQAGEPYNQRDLANDMGLAHSTVRKLISNHTHSLEK